MSSELPTIEFVGEDGVRREFDFQRDPQTPWRVVLVESVANADGEWRHAGTERLRELRVDGEPRTAVSLSSVESGL